MGFATIADLCWKTDDSVTESRENARHLQYVQRRGGMGPTASLTRMRYGLFAFD